MTRYIRTLIQEKNNSCTVIQYIFVSRQVSVDESIYNLPVFLTSMVAPPCGHIYTCTKKFSVPPMVFVGSCVIIRIISTHILITLVRLLRVSVIHSLFSSYNLFTYSALLFCCHHLSPGPKSVPLPSHNSFILFFIHF